MKSDIISLVKFRENQRFHLYLSSHFTFSVLLSTHPNHFFGKDRYYNVDTGVLAHFLHASVTCGFSWYHFE